MITITKEFGFDYGHRVLEHEGKCKHLHGHRGQALVTVTAPELDKLGRVIDFGCLKTIIGGWIDANWDHNMIFHANDPVARVDWIFAGKRPYILMGLRNPTAENLAQELWLKTSPMLADKGIGITRVDFYETPTSMATFIPEDMK